VAAVEGTIGSAMLETWNWLTSLDTGFAFLLALPFVVGLLGLAKLAFETKGKSREDR
jgi:hypothetical protein